MSEHAARHEVAARRAVFVIPGMDAADVTRDIPRGEAGAAGQTIDIYRPAAAGGGALPAVVLVVGYADGSKRPLP
jgi:hypothetical protein